jgi:hypothetical protein
VSPTINNLRLVAISCNFFIIGITCATSPAPPSYARPKIGTAPSAATAIPAWTCFKSGRRSFGCPNFGTAYCPSACSYSPYTENDVISQ